MTTWSGTLPTWTVEEITALDLQTMTDATHGLTDAWSTWSPTTANLTLGNGTIIARYRQSGKTGDFIFSFTLGSTSAIGTLPSFTLPFTPQATFATFATMGHGELLDSGTAAYIAVGRWTAGSAVEVVYGGASGIHTSVTATAPFTWTTSDRLLIHGKAIEIA